MIDVGTLLLGYLTYFVATASPGPANLAIMSTSASAGRRSGLLMALGVESGSVFWGICAGLGLSSLMLSLPALFVLLKLVGGVYLLWLAFKSWKLATGRTEIAAGVPVDADSNFYLQGMMIHLTNPKAILGWSATIAVGVPAGGSVLQIGAMLIGCFLMGISIFCGYALLFSTAKAQEFYLKFAKKINVVLTAVFGVAGLKLLTDAR